MGSEVGARIRLIDDTLACRDELPLDGKIRKVIELSENGLPDRLLGEHNFTRLQLLPLG